MDEAGDPRADSGEEGGGEPRPEGPHRRIGVRWGGGGGAANRAEVGVGIVVLQAARREPGAGPVPEAVEQPRRRLQEDQGMGVADKGGERVVLGDEERRPEGEEASGVFR